jgi:SnoaL-like domain
MEIDADSLRMLKELSDRQLILDCVHRYMRGIDRHDVRLIASAFHAGAVGDFGAYIGPLDGFPNHANATHDQKWTAHQHFVLNHYAQLAVDSAHAETYWMVAGRRRDGGVDLHGGRYADRFERRSGIWGIVDRVCIYEWGFDPVEATQIMGIFETGVQDNVTDLSSVRPLKVRRPFNAPVA